MGDSVSYETAEFYPPSEDTGLLIDALRADLARLRATCRARPVGASVIVELGSGSGAVLHALACTQRTCGAPPDECRARLLDDELTQCRPLFFATDVNSAAMAKLREMQCRCQLTDVELVQADLLEFWAAPQSAVASAGAGSASCISLERHVQLDVLVFNPPYVATDQQEFAHALEQRDIYASWAGGENGAQVILRFVQQIANVMADGGLVYLLMLDVNRPLQIAELMKANGFQGECIETRTTGIERLSVWRFTYSSVESNASHFTREILRSR